MSTPKRLKPAGHRRWALRLGLLVVVVALAGCSGSGTRAATRQAATTTVAPVPDVTTAAAADTGSTTTAVGPSGTTTTQGTVTPQAGTTAPAGACVNSADSTCGPFTWSPQPPADRPLTLSVTAVPAAPRAGQDVVFTVTYADPDGSQPPAGCDTQSQTYGDGSPTSRRVCDDATTCTWTGPHTPPAPAGARWSMTYHHSYTRAGKFLAEFTGTSRTAGTQSHCADAHTGRSGDPYASAGAGTLTVTVSS